MARRFVRPIEIPCGKRTAQRHKDLLRTHRRTILPRYENTVEMLTAKNNWLSAQQEELQSRFMALLNLKLLDYYENKPLTLD